MNLLDLVLGVIACQETIVMLIFDFVINHFDCQFSSPNFSPAPFHEDRVEYRAYHYLSAFWLHHYFPIAQWAGFDKLPHYLRN